MSSSTARTSLILDVSTVGVDSFSKAVQGIRAVAGNSREASSVFIEQSKTVQLLRDGFNSFSTGVSNLSSNLGSKLIGSTQNSNSALLTLRNNLKATDVEATNVSTSIRTNLQTAFDTASQGITGFAQSLMRSQGSLFSFQGIIQNARGNLGVFARVLISNFIPGFNQLVNVISDAVTPAFDRLIDVTLNKFIPGIDQTVVALTSRLIPAFGSLVSIAVDNLLPTLGTLASNIVSRTIPVFGGLAGTIIDAVVPGVGSLVSIIGGPLVSRLALGASNITGLLTPALQRLASTIIGRVIPETVKLSDVIIHFANFAIRPLVRLILSSLIAKALQSLVRFITSRVISAFDTLAKSIEGFAKGGLSILSTGINNLVKFALSPLQRVIGVTLIASFDGIARIINATVVPAISFLRNSFINLGRGIANLARTSLTLVLNAFQGLGQAIANLFTTGGAFAEFGNLVQDTFARIVESVNRAIEAIGRFILSASKLSLEIRDILFGSGEVDFRDANFDEAGRDVDELGRATRRAREGFTKLADEIKRNVVNATRAGVDQLKQFNAQYDEFLRTGNIADALRGNTDLGQVFRESTDAAEQTNFQLEQMVVNAKNVSSQFRRLDPLTSQQNLQNLNRALDPSRQLGFDLNAVTGERGVGRGLRELYQEAERLGIPLANISKETIDAARGIRRLDKAGIDASRGIRRIGTNSKGAATQVRGLARAFNLLTVAFPLLSIGVLIARFTQAANAGARLSIRMNELSRTTGFSVSQIDAIRRGAQDLGINFEEAEGVLIQFNERVNEFREGTGEGAKVFRQLGLRVSDSEGYLKSSTELMSDYADAINNASDRTQALALNSDLFGDAGARLLPVLTNLNQLSEEEIERNERRQEAVDGLTRAWNRLAGATTDRLIGAFQDLAPTLTIIVDGINAITTSTLAAFDFITGRTFAFRNNIRRLQNIFGFGPEVPEPEEPERQRLEDTQPFRDQERALQDTYRTLGLLSEEEIFQLELEKARVEVAENYNLLIEQRGEEWAEQLALQIAINRTQKEQTEELEQQIDIYQTIAEAFADQERRLAQSSRDLFDQNTALLLQRRTDQMNQNQDTIQNNGSFTSAVGEDNSIRRAAANSVTIENITINADNPRELPQMVSQEVYQILDTETQEGGVLQR